MTRINAQVPNVIIAGVSKCGTTSLFRYLASHPDVCASAVKEINFFTHSGRDSLDLSLYGPQFERCSDRPRAVYLEASPIYLYYAGTVAPAMKATLPDIRLVFILRNPVDRFVSHFRYLQLKAGVIPHDVSLEAFISTLPAARGDMWPTTEADALEQCAGFGLYADNLPQYLDLFGRERVFVGFLEHLERSPREFMQQVCGFLDIRADTYRTYRFSVENRRRNPRYLALNRMAEVVTLRYERFFNRHPDVRARLRRVYHRINPEVGEPDAQRLTPGADAILRRFYAPSVAALGDLLARHYPSTEVPAWLADWRVPA